MKEQKKSTLRSGLFAMNIGIPVVRPPFSKLGKELESALRKAIFDFSLLDNGIDKVAIALSGGKDSLTLLFLLHAIRGRGFPMFDIIAIHVDGEFSCGAGVDKNFLRAICKELGVEWVVETSTQKKETLECYRCSRERRRLIFEAAKKRGARVVAFGHHRDDSAQTLLLNLFHKAEFAANLPKLSMKAFGITIIRPLIYIEEKAIYTFAKQQGFARISCQCPIGQHSKRKLVDQILNDLEIHFPNIRGNLAKAGILYGSKKAETP